MSEASAAPYQALVLAIVHRAVQDAGGRCASPGGANVAELEQEARAWLSDEDAVAGLLELAGYEPAPVLTRLRSSWNETGR